MNTNNLANKLLSIIVIICFAISFNSCSSDSGNDNQQDEMNVEETIYTELSNDNLLSNLSYNEFSDNINNSYRVVDIQKQSYYDSNLNKTNVTITIRPLVSSLENVSIVSYIPKSMASNVGQIEFENEPSFIVNDDPLVMWHLDCNVPSVLNLTMLFQGDQTTSGTTNDSVYAITDNEIENESTGYKVPYSVLAIAPETYLDQMVDMGMDIYPGCNFNSISIEGSYLVSTAFVVGSNNSAEVGSIDDDIKIRFYNNNSGNKVAKIKQRDTTLDNLPVMFSGDPLGSSFSAYLRFTRNIESDVTWDMLIVISGFYSQENISGLRIATVLIDNHGDINTDPNGTIVVMADGDYISESIPNF